jgi:sugar lactone lactonase YvrE
MLFSGDVIAIVVYRMEAQMKSQTKARLLFCSVVATSAWAFGQQNVYVQNQKPVVAQSTMKLQPVFEFDNGPAPSAVAVSDNDRIFVGFACSHEANQNQNTNDNLQQNGYHCGLAELKYTGGDTNGGHLAPFPNLEINRYDQDHPEDHFVDVRAIRVEGSHLWVLDSAAPENGTFIPGGAKLVCINLANDQIDRTIHIPEHVTRANSCLDQIRFVMRGDNGGFAYISDSSPSGPAAIIVVDLTTGHAWRRLSDTVSVNADPGYTLTAEAQQLNWSGPQAQQASSVQPPTNAAEQSQTQNQAGQPVRIGVEALAVSNDGSTLFYAPLSSNRLYSIDTNVLCKHATNDQNVNNDQLNNNGDMTNNADINANENPNRDAINYEVSSAVHDCGDKGFPTNSMDIDNQGNLYLTDVQNGAIRERSSDGQFTAVMQDPRIAWPASLCLATDNDLHEHFMYFVSTQFDRKPAFHNGDDQRKPPYYMFRFLVNNGPGDNR